MLTIPSMRTKGCVGKIKAYFSVSFGDIIVNDLRLIVGTNGPFVAFPSRQYTTSTGEKKYADIVSWSRTAEGNFTDGASELQDEILRVASQEFERRSGESLETTAAVSTDSSEVSSDDDDDLPF